MPCIYKPEILKIEPTNIAVKSLGHLKSVKETLVGLRRSSAKINTIIAVTKKLIFLIFLFNGFKEK